MKPMIRCAVIGLFLDLAWGQDKQAEKTDAEIKQAIINESIAKYRGKETVLAHTIRTVLAAGAGRAVLIAALAVPPRFAIPMMSRERWLTTIGREQDSRVAADA